MCKEKKKQWDKKMKGPSPHERQACVDDMLSAWFIWNMSASKPKPTHLFFLMGWMLSTPVVFVLNKAIDTLLTCRLFQSSKVLPMIRKSRSKFVDPRNLDFNSFLPKNMKNNSRSTSISSFLTTKHIDLTGLQTQNQIK